MSFPVPVKYLLTDDKNETVVVYNDGREERLPPWGDSAGDSGDVQISFTGDISDPSNIIPVSYNEIKNRLLSGKTLRLVNSSEEDDYAFYTVYTLVTIEEDDGRYYASFTSGGGLISITSDNPDGYMHA